MGSRMRLELQEITTLPCLSWCARVNRGRNVQVLHGAWVETRPDRFVEGAWDGDLMAFDFDKAEHLAGSGGVIRGDEIVFASAFHPMERLFVLQGEDETLVSNSLVFLLEQAGDGLDLEYPHYFFDLLRASRRGVLAPATLRTARGRQVEMHGACRLVVDAKLRLERRPQPLGPPPADFDELFELLSGVTRRIVDNAADSGRRSTFRPVTACSRGFDSTAAAALAKQVGCTEGVTFKRSGVAKGHPAVRLEKPLVNDSGAECLRALGMEAHEFDRLDVLDLPGHPKAEFFLSIVAPTDASTRVMEDRLRGSIFFSGRHGERYWGVTSRCKRRHYAEVDECNLNGYAALEFRLRAGFIHYPPLYVRALHGPALYRITHSPEMRPWNLGKGYYERPIARRIAEEAGVPREAFGQVKYGGSDEGSALGEESERDFQQFLRSRVPERIRQRLDPRTPQQRKTSHHRVKYLRTNYAHWPFASTLLDVLQTDRMHKMWNSVYLYTFHWGFEKIRARYAAPARSRIDGSALHVA